ncbi:MAG TPA: gamma-glutamyl-gamma-aminobutyrate hydrolase family protein [Actinomycetota bacterium]|nr:gamma-glutamyl-gamma-aminobutyrate hydrolase family protein [Actinomycetota bacterium]
MDTTPAPTSPIVVVAQWRKGYARLPVPYTHAVELAGGDVRVAGTFDLPPGSDEPEGDVTLGIDPMDASVLDGAAGLLRPGGGDIDPEWYGGERHPRTHNVSHRRDRFELTLLEEALHRDMPVLAICHGMQLLNVHLGGTLEQHLADDPDRLDHDRDRPRAEPVHDVTVEHATVLSEAIGTHTPVNSHHHQGLGRVAEELRQIAWAEDGVLEAVSVPEHSWVLGVQWHPEAMADTDERQKAIFERFLDAAAAYDRGQMARAHARTA